jgi:hypothetical protein
LNLRDGKGYIELMGARKFLFTKGIED